MQSRCRAHAHTQQQCHKCLTQQQAHNKAHNFRNKTYKNNNNRAWKRTKWFARQVENENDTTTITTATIIDFSNSNKQIEETQNQRGETLALRVEMRIQLKDENRQHWSFEEELNSAFKHTHTHNVDFVHVLKSNKSKIVCFYSITLRCKFHLFITETF